MSKDLNFNDKKSTTLTVDDINEIIINPNDVDIDPINVDKTFFQQFI